SIRFTSIAIRPKTPRNGWDKRSAMKRFIIIVCAVLLLAGGTWYASLYFGLYIDLNPDTPVTVLFRTQGTEIQRQAGAGAWESMRIRGVDVSSNLPGDPPMDFAPEEEDYLRWF